MAVLREENGKHSGLHVNIAVCLIHLVSFTPDSIHLKKKANTHHTETENIEDSKNVLPAFAGRQSVPTTRR